MARGAYITPELAAEIRKLSERDMGKQEIANRLGISKPSVHKVLTGYGGRELKVNKASITNTEVNSTPTHTRRRSKTVPKRVAPVDPERVREMWDIGSPPKEIATQLRVSTLSVNRALRSLGIAPTVKRSVRGMKGWQIANMIGVLFESEKSAAAYLDARLPDWRAMQRAYVGGDDD